MIDLTNSSTCLELNKDYLQIFKKNLILGYNVGAATIISNLAGAPALHENPFLNRLINLGTYNALEDIHFSRINSDWKSDTDNFVFLGILQTVKYISGQFTQNAMKILLYKPEESIALKKFTDSFIITSTGMAVFFSVGSINSKILTEEGKIKFVAVSNAALFMCHLLTSPYNTKYIKDTKVTYLSLNDFIFTSLGLVGAYVVPDVMHKMGIDKGGVFEPDKVLMFKMSINAAVAIVNGFDINLIASSVLINECITEPLVRESGFDKAEFFEFNLINIASLSVLAAAALVKGDIVSNAVIMAAFPVAKAVAVTGIEKLDDNKEYICSNFILEPVCKYLGIIDDVQTYS